MGRIEGKVAIVTGGASGFGECISQMLAREGAEVVIGDIAENEANRVVDEICSAGGKAIYLPLDVTREADWKRLMAEVAERFGRLNILVNNAGISPSGSMEMEFELWRKTLSVNLDGTFLGCKYAIETMRATQSVGSIVNISSVMAMVAQPTTVAYSASKGGVRSLTKAAAIYCADKKLPIRVNSIHPGTCTTPLVKKYYDSRPPEELKAQIDRHPIGHLGEPADIAYAVLYLASDESKFMLGSELVIDGGLLASDGFLA